MQIRFWGTRGSLPVAPHASIITDKIADALLHANGKSFADKNAAATYAREAARIRCWDRDMAALPAVSKLTREKAPLSFATWARVCENMVWTPCGGCQTDTAQKNGTFSYRICIGTT